LHKVKIKRLHPAATKARNRLDVRFFAKEKEVQMFSIIAWIIFGLIAGVIAKMLMPGNDPGGFIITILLGIAGAIVGGFLAGMLGLAGETGSFGDRGFLIRLVFAVIGAIILLALYRVIAGRRT
jgi:uncharacterized membrane protein YeaQ/YmgE (transglycosylase-associated protein family)